MSIIKKFVLPLIAAAAMFVNNARADDQPLVLPAGLFADDAAMRAWENTDFGPAQGEVSFNGMPVTEIVKRVTGIYKNRFDVIMPPLLPGADATGINNLDPNVVQVKLELRNVGPAEIFNAMNLYWQAAGTGVHWKLIVNGTRPTAIYEANMPPPMQTPPPKPQEKTTVYSIAELLNSTGKFKDPQFIAINVASILEESSPKDVNYYMDHIRIRLEAGLLVFRGTSEETDLVRSTLEAMKQTVQAQRPPPGGELLPQEQNLKK